MSFSSRLEDAFTKNDVTSIVMVITEEKSSPSLVDRLDEVASKELHNNEFTKVTLLLRAVAHIISKDENCINRLVHQGVVIKVSDYLKLQQKSAKGPVQLIEAFFEVSMNLCQSNIEGNSKILELLLLRFGAVVIDRDVKFGLRLEAIKTINSMLDNASKETRKKICQSEDHSFLLNFILPISFREEFAKVIIDVGDYEMQVAISEALCRMTLKRVREEMVGKWFNYRSFALTFTTIRVKEFETDCRKFLNELNSYFRDTRRVFSVPCIRAFLDFTELYKPEDDLLKMFWVDFNIGTSCISFYVNDPKGTLWELIHLPKEGLSTYNIQAYDDRKILSIHMSYTISHCGATGKMVQIVFGSEHDIQTIVERVFGEGEKLQLLKSPKRGMSHGEDSGIPATPTDSMQTFTSVPGTARAQVSFLLQSGPGKLPSAGFRGRRVPAEDIFSLRNESDTEVPVPKTLHSQLLSESGRSHDSKPETITFMAALQRYQVKRAKSVIFGNSYSSNGSVKSLPGTGGQLKPTQKRKLRVFHSESDSYMPPSERRFFKNTTPADYTRKRPRVKSKLKVLPVSSPSSDEEENFKRSGICRRFTGSVSSTQVESTPKRRLRERSGGLDGLPQGQQVRRQSQVFSHTSKETTDSGFKDKNTFDDTVFGDEQPVVFTKEQDINIEKQPSPHKRGRPASTDLSQDPELPLFASLKPRRLFPSTTLDSATETMTKTLMEDEESETELGSGVITAFNTFKIQLKEHFSSRYKRIEAKSLKSLTDCQRNVTSLLRSVHKQRLVRLENFQDDVVQQLGVLEERCRSLKSIEKETVSFWQSESNTVRAFCDKQQTRLDSLDIRQDKAETEPTKPRSRTFSDKHRSQSTSVPAGAEAEEIQGEPNTK